MKMLQYTKVDPLMEEKLLVTISCTLLHKVMYSF